MVIAIYNRAVGSFFVVGGGGGGGGERGGGLSENLDQNINDSKSHI